LFSGLANCTLLKTPEIYQNGYERNRLRWLSVCCRNIAEHSDDSALIFVYSGKRVLGSSTATLDASMPSLIMQKGRRKLHNVQAYGTSSAQGSKTEHQFCFSCENIFQNRTMLEEHTCPAASHICSCGTEFSLYIDMLEHSNTHEPGHQVLDHRTIKKRRFEKYIEEEEQLKRLESVGQDLWKVPRLDTVPTASLTAKSSLQAHIASPIMPEVSKWSAEISKLSKLHPALPQASFLPNPVHSTANNHNMFAGTGAPTVDLWTLYHPVVLVKTSGKLENTKPYSCGKCGECFVTKQCLISHHSAHGIDKVSGCVGCGLLISSRKMVPRFHQCNAPISSPKVRLVTAKPLSQLKLKISNTSRYQSPSSSDRSSSASHKSSQMLYVGQSQHRTSASDKSNHKLHMVPFQQLNPSASSKTSHMLYGRMSQQFKRHNLTVSAKNSQRFHVAPPQQVKTPTASMAKVCSSPSQATFVPNGFTCRVCHISFMTAQLLQRHKCVKAQEYMEKHGLASKQVNRYRKVTPMTSTNFHINGERRLGMPVSHSIKGNQVAAVGLDRGNGAFNLNGKRRMDLDDDDDCFIVESNPASTTEMIYQVTSSLPVKT
ncbi:hypothetical protein LDENG_00064930, partial [Lucifuga dentata]